MKLDHQQIKQYNPQRYPIALVDRILSCDAENGIVAIKAVTATEPCYADIPDTADIADMAYPNSLMVESFCQAAGPLSALLGLEFPGKVMLFVSMSDVEILGAAHPGDVMTHHVRVVKLLSDAVVGAGEVRVDGKVIMRLGQLMVAARDELKVA